MKVMNIWGKLKDFIFQDVDNENETKRAAVIIRLFSLIMCFYFIIQMIVYCLCAEWFSAVVSILCLCGYVTAFYNSYRNRTQFTVIYTIVSTILWVVLYVYLFGWDCGAQHFLFALLVFLVVVSHVSSVGKISMAALLCAIRLGLFWYTRVHEPFLTLSERFGILLQVINTVIIFSLITVIVVMFSKDSLSMEKKLVEYNEKLKEVSLRDPLTKLYNRRAMLEYLEHLTKESEKAGKGFDIAIGDIDFFKNINDTYGHTAGDVVLEKIAELLSGYMKNKGNVCRWGGEEFLLVFNGINGEEATAELENIRNLIANTEILYNNQAIRITMTFGLDEYSSHHPIDETLKSADNKLYIGKNTGRNRVVF